MSKLSVGTSLKTVTVEDAVTDLAVLSVTVTVSAKIISSPSLNGAIKLILSDNSSTIISLSLGLNVHLYESDFLSKSVVISACNATNPPSIIDISFKFILIMSLIGVSTAGVSTAGVSTTGVSTAGDDTIVGLTVCWVVSFVDEPPQAVNKKIKVIGVIKLIFLLIGNFLECKRA